MGNKTFDQARKKAELQRKAREELASIEEASNLVKFLSSNLDNEDAGELLKKVSPAFNRLYSSLIIDFNRIREAETLAETYQRFVTKYHLEPRAYQS